MTNSERSKAVIIVAGGSGTRMGADMPKQFLLLKGKPVLMHTIEAFFEYSPEIQIVVVLPYSQFHQWEALKKKYDFPIAHQIADGGSERFFSVRNGLKLIEKGRLVAVHDGVRPLVSQDTISSCFELAAHQKTAIPVVDIVDSIRKVTADGNESVRRNLYKIVQTPQVFDYNVIVTSYNTAFSPSFTDDASVVEAAGFAIHLTDGNAENIKLTTQIDMAIAEILMDK